jgi:hypothetical protein
MTRQLKKLTFTVLQLVMLNVIIVNVIIYEMLFTNTRGQISSNTTELFSVIIQLYQIYSQIL